MSSREGEDEEKHEYFRLGICDLEKLCASKNLSLDALRGLKICKQLPCPHDGIKKSSFLHSACANAKVTLEIVEFLLALYPAAADICIGCDHVYDDEEGEGEEEDKNGVYALHLACYNNSCTSSVIELLVKKNPSALRHFGQWDYQVHNLPLHYFLARDSNIDEEVLHLLIDACPEALTNIAQSVTFGSGVGGAFAPSTPLCEFLSRTGRKDIINYFDIVRCLAEADPSSLLLTNDEDGGTPLHIVCHDESIELRMLRLFLDLCPESASKQDECGGLPIHEACRNRNITLEAVQLLVDKSPNSVRHADENGALPLHILSRNGGCDEGESLGVLCLLLELYPEAASRTEQLRNRVRSAPPSLPIHLALGSGHGGPGRIMSAAFCKILIDAYHQCLTVSYGRFGPPIHQVVRTGQLEMIEYLLKLRPDSVGMRNTGNGFLPIHQAAFRNDPEHQVFRPLLKYDPDGLSRVVEEADIVVGGLTSTKYEGCLPLHLACAGGRIDTVKFLFDHYPEALRARSAFGYLPIHEVANRECGTENAKIIQFLLERDPDGASRAVTFPDEWDAPDNKCLPLHLACAKETREGRLAVDFNAARILFDSYPRAIYRYEERDADDFLLDRAMNDPKVCSFLHPRLVYAQKARDMSAMRTADDNGWLELHHALHEKLSLGSIKLLVEGYPQAMQVSDSQGLFPLHIASEFSTAGLVKFLVEQDSGCLNICGGNKDSPLHYACRAGNCGVVKYLLERQVPSVSERNANKKLPIHLLCESKADKKHTEYVESIWLLLLAYPEVVMNWDGGATTYENEPGSKRQKPTDGQKTYV